MGADRRRGSSIWRRAAVLSSLLIRIGKADQRALRIHSPQELEPGGQITGRETHRYGDGRLASVRSDNLVTVPFVLGLKVGNLCGLIVPRRIDDGVELQIVHPFFDRLTKGDTSRISIRI